MNLNNKFRLGVVLLVFIPVIIMGTVSYIIFSSMIENKTNSYYRVSLQDTDRKLEYALNEISTVSDLAMTQENLQYLLKNVSQLNNEQIQWLINRIMTHPKITSFQLYSGNKMLYSTNGTDSLSTKLDEFPWYERMLKLQGRPLWIGPGENGTYATDQPVLIHARIIKDYNSLENIGAIVITVKPDVLEQALWGANTIASSDILLLNSAGTVVFDKSRALTGSAIDVSLLKQLEGQDYQIAKFQGKESMITTVLSSHEGWVLTAATPLEELRAESITIRNVAIVLILFSLFMGIIFERVYIRKLVRTILISVKGMNKVRQGQFIQISSPNRWKDETRMLIDGFNSMSNQIRDLLLEVELEQKRKQQAEMHALVAQINPHFIYNSLESINSMAVLAGNRDISRMVVSLGKLLRISISEQVESIPLSMELEHVKHYLNIQKMRFRDKFDYEISCPSELQHLHTLKLIVQPLVENALYHGIEPKQDAGFIQIEVMELGNDIIIQVKDTGLGFSLSQLEEEWKNPASTEKKYTNSGVGLRNVYERIRIQYGKPFGLMICSAEDYGTTIRIRIPKLE